MEGKQRYIASRAGEGFALVVVRRDVGGDWYASSDSDESDQESGLTADAAIRAWQAEYQPDGWHDLDELLARPTLADVERARAEEREACAAIVDAQRSEEGIRAFVFRGPFVLADIAGAIRARAEMPAVRPVCSECGGSGQDPYDRNGACLVCSKP